MKLYKEASLMMLPTSVKDGKLYSIFPQPKVIGEELITNGGFDTDSDWNKGTGWTISGGKAISDGSQSSSNLRQDNILTVGSAYKIDVTVSDYVSGALEVSAGAVPRESVTRNGTFSFYQVADPFTNLYFVSKNLVGSIDNISVREVDQAPADFTFSRGSNLAATRINEQGLIEKGRENLLLQSNQFDTTWSNINSDETGGQTGYDGTNDAWKFISTTTGSDQRIVQSFTAVTGIYNFSFYAKAGTYSEDVYLRSSGSTVYRAYFTLSDGSTNSGVNMIDSKSTDVGNGWYRFEAIFNVSSATTFELRFRNTNTSGDYFYIQDAQLEAGLVATDYIESGATTGKAGVLEDLPRLDWSGSCPTLLLEPQRANLITHSEYLDSHTKNAFTLVNFSNVTCPIEGVKVSQIIDSNSGGNGRLALYKALNLTASTTYTASVFAKADQLNFIYFSFDGSPVNLEKRVWFNLSTGQVGTESGGATGSIESFGDGWYRCVMVFTTDNTGILNTKFAPAEEDNNINVDRDGTSSVFATAMQIEEGSYPTSYIPTHGTSATRSADDLERLTNLSTDGIANNYSTTIFFEGTNFKTTDNTRFVTLYNASVSNNPRVLLYSGNGVSGNPNLMNINLQYKATGQSDVNISTPSMSRTPKFKAIMRLDDTNLSLFVNGVKYSSTIVPANDIEVLDLVDVANDLSHTISELTIFPTALSDNECINLTTI